MSQLPHESSQLENDNMVTDCHRSNVRLPHAPTPPPPPLGEETRVHDFTLKELAIVDESPLALIAPVLSGPKPGTVSRCRASYGRIGRAKAFRGPAVQMRGSVTLYGEDAVTDIEPILPLISSGTERERWARVIGVFDGHGMSGKDAARLAADKLIRDIERTATDTLVALLAGDVARVRRIELERFLQLDCHLEKELKSPTGGTTCSTVQFMTAGNKSFMVVSNVGDSPVLLINNRTAHVSLLTGRHSWDNPEERQKYLDRCASLGLTPRDVVYGRINCGGMRMEDADGTEEPFKMYLPGTATICTKTRDHLCKQVERRFKNSIGGSQSIRRYVMERQTPQGGWEIIRALEEHAHVNWGATILVNKEGKIQMSRSLGDIQEKQTAYIWAEPDVAIHEFGPNEDWTVVACSDGVSDLWYFHELGELAVEYFKQRPEGDVQLLTQLILEQTIERGERTPGYGVGPRITSSFRGEAVKRPMWDDVAIQCARIRTEGL